MAGLQYNFFPTDLLYPLKPPAEAATATEGADGPIQQVSMAKTWNSEESENLKNNSKGKIVKAVSSSLVAFSPITHKHENKWTNT
ncbi:hypothetical protein AAHA92_15817 [Salvia divinorum]|uniref:Uncharacterized protein n=1 Tax=Salvia divinorum TaxID=28513 RepID=A0ABD1HIG3_SALDI